jgi:DNA-binding MarR family transcriptional regulator
MYGSSERGERVIRSIRQIIRAVDLHSRYLAKKYGLTGPQLMILRDLTTHGETSVGEVAKRISLSQATVTNVLDRLENIGYVKRARSEHDKRKVIVGITPTGKRKLDGAPSLLQEYFIHEFERLAEWEQTLMLSSLQRVASMMNAGDIKGVPVLASGAISLSANDIIEYTDTGCDEETGRSGG